MAKKRGKKIKHGRNKVKCERYRKEGRKTKNQVKRLLKHLERFPNDKQTLQKLESLKNSRVV